MDGIRLRIGSDLNNLFRRARQEIAVKKETTVGNTGPLVPASSLMNRSLWYKLKKLETKTNSFIFKRTYINIGVLLMEMNICLHLDMKWILKNWSSLHPVDLV